MYLLLQDRTIIGYGIFFRECRHQSIFTERKMTKLKGLFTLGEGLYGGQFCYPFRFSIENNPGARNTRARYI